MKRSILIFFLTVMVWAQPSGPRPDFEMSLGLGGFLKQDPYRNEDVETMAIPLVDVRYKKVYFRGLVFGANLWQAKGHQVDLRIRPELNDLDPEENELFEGMQEREMTVLAGLIYQKTWARRWQMEVQVDHDILDRSQSLEASLALNRLWVGPRTFFRLGVETVYQNDQGLQYYYGVSEDEASVTRTTYQPEDGVDLGLSGMFSMKVGEKTTWTAFANWRRFSSEVTESPLVDREDGFFFLTGISWKIR